MRDRRLQMLVAAAMAVAVVILASVIDLERVPPLWWDEGWTMTVARNWVERGHFGLYSMGEPAPPSLSAAFPTVASVALSFKLLGVGVWQARLPGMIYGLGSLGLLYLLGRQLFNRTVAIGAIICALLVSSSTLLNPILVSRQVLAEMPMLFFLLLGYWAFGQALLRSPWFIFLASAAWGLALITKAQPLPFWIASLATAVLVAIWRRRWRRAVPALLGLIGGYIASYAWFLVQAQVLRGQPGALAVPGLYDITAFVTEGSVRLHALLIMALVGLPTLFALGYTLIKWWRQRSRFLDSAEHLAQLVLLVFAGSWLAWYGLLSIGWERYLMPALFAGSLFVAAAAQDLWTPFVLKRRRPGEDGSSRQPRARIVGALSLLLMLIFSISIGVVTLGYNLRPGATLDASDVAAFINTHSPITALIETFDSEVFFFLERRYHYPPGVTQVEAVRRLALNQDVPISYDPLAADPDYLVLGPFSRGWNVYAAALASGAFRSIYANSRYIVYERIR